MILVENRVDMAPRKSQSSRSQTSDQDDYDDDDYRKRRDRNNQAVKKSRFKSKQKTQETQERISKLKKENEELEDKVKTKSKELGILKDLFLATCGANSAEKMSSANLEKLLEEEGDDAELTSSSAQ